MISLCCFIFCGTNMFNAGVWVLQVHRGSLNEHGRAEQNRVDNRLGSRDVPLSVPVGALHGNVPG